MTRHTTRARLWLVCLLVTTLACGVCLAVSLNRLGASITGFGKAASLQGTRKQGLALRKDVAELFAAQLDVLQQSGPQPMDEYRARWQEMKERVGRVTGGNNAAPWAPGLRRQFEAWCRQAETMFTKTSGGQAEPKPEAIALLTRQGNQMLVMLAVLDQQWTERADDWLAMGRRERRGAVRLAAASGLAALPAVLSGIAWRRARRLR